MNKHIELVKKWLFDPRSVSKEELEFNYYTVANAFGDSVTYETYAATYSAYAACRDKDIYSGFITECRSDAAFWVKRCEELAE